jgi:competence protein ComEC
LDFGNGVSLEVLHPPAGYTGKANDASVVLRLVRNGRGLALLCGDIEKKAIRTLLASGRDLMAEVLVLPHHGSASSLTGHCTRRCGRARRFVSCGEFNRFNYPSDKIPGGIVPVGLPGLRHGGPGRDHGGLERGRPRPDRVLRPPPRPRRPPPGD